MRFLGRAIAGFQRQYPQVEVELSLNDRKVDLVEEGFDLAIRVSNLADSSLIARPLAKVRDRCVRHRIICCAMAYRSIRTNWPSMTA
jgi:DNA-binding transcriptional LysR family regulator